MADQQNPKQNDDQSVATEQNTTQSNDISDVGDLLLDQSSDQAQAKAEAQPETVAGDSESPANATQTDPTLIDLGDISLPTNEEIAKSEGTNAPVGDVQPSGMFRAPESEQTDLQDISIEAVEPTATETTDSTEPLPQAEGAQAVQEANPPVGDIDSDTIEAPLAPENQDTMPTIDTDISLNDVPRAPQEESNTTSELAEPSTKENKPHEEHLVFKNPDEDVAKGDVKTVVPTETGSLLHKEAGDMEDTIITNDNTNDVLETNEPISPNPTEIAIEEDNRDVPTVEEATPTDELPIQEEPVADNVENPVPEEVGAEQDSLQIENNDIELNEPTQENIVDQNANETAEEVTPVDEEVANSQEQLPTASDLPLEETDNEADTLLQNESEAVSSPDEAIENTELETTNQETPAAEEMTLDLDSLTEDMGMPENQESTPMQQANKETPAAIPAVTTSVPLPNATAVQSKGVKNASKKKAFAMIAAFVALLIVGGFVFNTMMPQESDNLVANILGSSSEQNNNMNPEVPLVEQPVDTNSVAIPDSQTDEMLPQEQPAIETPATNPVVTISMQQAQNALELIAHNSKRSLADALKAQNQELTESLYAIFKNSSNLLETLANTSDISTIPDIEQQISDLQSDLIEDIKLLDDTSNNAQSQ